ncbi:LysM peptidoglycan-binding domain-containing protein [Alloscardovia omnicolens]|uniref:LysM peptidoglycan-binding domain-containing protein n=1 Tax=Alloscardovia omnicolens TaxID=419015 RepID=UPI003A71C246
MGTQRSVRHQQLKYADRPVKLNRRGKMVVWFLSCALAMGCASFVIPAATAQSEGVQTVSYTVQPHDTLWNYAAQITPQGEDVYETMEYIKKLNHMDTDQLVTGQTLIVPEA